MKKYNDSRINVRNRFIKEFCVLFLVLAAFNGFHVWIYQSLKNSGIFETNEQLGINLLMIYVIVSAMAVTALIALSRYRSWTLPIKILGAAAREIAKGNLSVRVKTPSKSELRNIYRQKMAESNLSIHQLHKDMRKDLKENMKKDVIKALIGFIPSSPIKKDIRKDAVEALYDDFNTIAEELAFVNNNLQKLVDEKTERVDRLQNAILRTMSDLVEFRDNITGGHTERTQRGVKLLFDEINKRGLFTDIVSNWDYNLVLQSAQLHDIGKIAIPDQILKKPGTLTKDEFDEIKKHALLGLDIIERIETSSGENDLLNHAKIFASTHHEKWDGTGYPKGLQGDEIPLHGRIMAIVDVYDALVSERPYKKAFTHEEALEIINERKGTHFDPVLVDLFMNISEEYRK